MSRPSAAVDRLDTNVATLDRVVTSERSSGGNGEANQVTPSSRHDRSYKLSVPVE